MTIDYEFPDRPRCQDIAAVAAAEAADAADDAAEAAAAAAAAAPAIDPAIVAAEVAINEAEQATERERIRARADVRIAEAVNEEPTWLAELRECLTRLETTQAEILMRLPAPSIPPALPATVIVTEPEGPTMIEAAGDGESGEATPESLAAVAPETVPEAAPAPVVRRKPRWI